MFCSSLINVKTLPYTTLMSLGTDLHVEASDGRTSGSKPKDCTSLSKQQRCDLDNSNELEAMRASNVAFNSMPPMHFDGRAEGGYPGSSGSPLVPCAEISKQLLSKSCPDPRDCEQSPRMDGDLFQQIEGSSQRKIFSSHWSLEAVNEALEVCLRCSLYFFSHVFFRKRTFKLYLLDLIVVFSSMYRSRRVKLLRHYFG